LARGLRVRGARRDDPTRLPPPARHRGGAPPRRRLGRRPGRPPGGDTARGRPWDPVLRLAGRAGGARAGADAHDSAPLRGGPERLRAGPPRVGDERSPDPAGADPRPARSPGPGLGPASAGPPLAPPPPRLPP